MLDALTAVVSPQEPAARAAWDFGRDLLLLIIAALTCWWTVIRPWWTRVEAKRTAEREAKRKADDERLREQVEAIAIKVVRPVLAQLLPNGGSSTHDYARKGYEETSHLRREVAQVRDAQKAHETSGREFLEGAVRELAEQGIHITVDPRGE